MASHADVTVRYEPDADRSDIERIVDGVFRANAVHMEDERREPLPIMLRDAKGGLIGGAFARLVFGELYVDNIWISPTMRGKGWGRQIVEEAERLARARGAAWAFANTLLPASRRFFEANGYLVFAEVDGMPPGHRVTFLRKRLAG